METKNRYVKLIPRPRFIKINKTTNIPIKNINTESNNTIIPYNNKKGSRYFKLPPIRRTENHINTSHCISNKRSPLNSPLFTNLSLIKQRNLSNKHNTSEANSILIKNNSVCKLCLNPLPTIAIVKSHSGAKNITKTKKTIKRKVSIESLAGQNEYSEPKTNQDNSLYCKDILDNEGFDILGIFDGHGVNGHHVSSFISNYIKNYFTTSENFPSTASSSLLHLLYKNKFEFLMQFIQTLQNNLSSLSYDIQNSGSTCLLLFIINKHIIVSNTGDSRYILVSSFNERRNGFTYVRQYSIDQKPNQPNERKRIEAMGGEVFQSNDNAPYRVYAIGKDFPGIAMSRSLGDLIAKKIGVICDPVISLINITQKDRYLVVASDGLWDVLDNKTVMNIVNSYYIKNDSNGATIALINESCKRYDERNQYRDDITVIVYFFEYDYF